MMQRIIVIASFLASLLTLGGAFWFNQVKAQKLPEQYAQVFLRPVEVIPLLKANILENNTVAKVHDLQLTAQSVYITDVSSGAVLYKKNEHVYRAPASTAKLLTALVARKAFSLDLPLTITTEPEVLGTKVGFSVGEQITVETALKALLIQSGNDAAFALANAFPGGATLFVEAMNAHAVSLGLRDSHFDNPAGLDAVEQYTTAYDLALLAREVSKDPLLAEIVATPATTITDTSGTITHYLSNTNTLLREDSRVVGIKTGTTEEAGQVLITQYTTETGTIIVVLMGSEDRFADTQTIVEWLYDSYEWKVVDGILKFN